MLRRVFPGRPGIEGAREHSPAKPALRHGVYADEDVAMLCDNCGLADTCSYCEARDDGRCAIEMGYLEWRRPLYYRIVEAHGHFLPLHEYTLERLLFAELRVQRAERWMIHRNDQRRVDGDDVPTGINKHYSRALADVKALREELGITAAGMEKLEVKRSASDANDFFGRLGSTKRPRVLEVEDVEFEEDGDGGDDNDNDGRLESLPHERHGPEDGNGNDGRLESLPHERHGSEGDE